MVCGMSLLTEDANLCKIALPLCYNSGVYAKVFTSVALFDFGKPYPYGIDSTVFNLADI
jgi:hypothetical protein